MPSPWFGPMEGGIVDEAWLLESLRESQPSPGTSILESCRHQNFTAHLPPFLGNVVAAV